MSCNHAKNGGEVCANAMFKANAIMEGDIPWIFSMKHFHLLTSKITAEVNHSL